MDTDCLFVLPKDSQTGQSTLASQYILRSCNRDYKQELNRPRHYAGVEELDCNKVPGKIATLITFDNMHGHWVDSATRVFPPEHFDTISKFVDKFAQYMTSTKANGRLWDLDCTTLIDNNSVLRRKNSYPKEFVNVCRHQERSPYLPISVHTAQAFVESSEKRGRKKGLYNMPSQSTVVTGIFGGLSNNTTLEMGFIEKEGTTDAIQRSYDPSLIGFVCAGHTSHSGDAGKSRRMVSYSRVRVLSRSILDFLHTMPDSSVEPCDWIVYCMGLTFCASEENIWYIVHSLNTLSCDYFQNQFKLYTEDNLMCPATYMIYESDKILYLSVSSGVVLKYMPNGEMIDSCMMRLQKSNSIIEHSMLPSGIYDEVKFKFCPFFMTVPFVEHDRPPRTLFASGQSTQGIFLPWSPATARVMPSHSSRPIVATQFVRDIEHDFETNDDAIWDVFPGEDMTVCYMNMPENYDDSMIVSSAYADRGGFSTLSVCTYRVSESENVPEVGEKMCNKKYKWWKVDCTSTCTCKSKAIKVMCNTCTRADKLCACSHSSKSRIVSTSGRIPSGTVHEVMRTEDGHTSIKIISFSQLLTGDKISTLHGQKGVVRIVPSHELPMIKMKDGSDFIADLYIAVGSIVSRQTNGQIYESSEGLRGAREGKMKTVSTVENLDSEECDYILDPTTGDILLRELPSGTIEPVKATVGVTRVLNQTQMTRERHHLTHKSEGKYSTGTKSGRADGGGVSSGEMEFHAMFSSGLYGCAQELLNRGNMTLLSVCRHCNALKQLHDCGMNDSFALAAISYDVAIFDQMSAVINKSCNRYKIEHI